MDSIEQVNSNFSSLFESGRSLLGNGVGEAMDAAREEAFAAFVQAGGLPQGTENYRYGNLLPVFGRDYNVSLKYVEQDVNLSEVFQCNVPSLDTSLVLTINGWYWRGNREKELPAGDVKYHQGFVRDISTPGGPVHLSLAFNPSHLEIVDPVVEGSTKARMMHRGDTDGSQVMPVLVHGDASFSGQGVVQETLNMAQTRGYSTGDIAILIFRRQRAAIRFRRTDDKSMRFRKLPPSA